MAALDAAERDLDAAFARFEALVTRLRAWRTVETEAAAAVARAESESRRFVAAAAAEAEQARGDRAAAQAERSEIAERLAEVERVATAEHQRLTADLAAAHDRLAATEVLALQRAEAADRRIEELERQVPQLAADRAALEQENLRLRSEAERQTGEILALRSRADHLEAGARETLARLQQLLVPGD